VICTDERFCGGRGNWEKVRGKIGNHDVCLWRSVEERVHESESDSVVLSVGGCLRKVMERGEGGDWLPEYPVEIIIRGRRKEMKLCRLRIVENNYKNKL
jgi:hypothetical protein